MSFTTPVTRHFGSDDPAAPLVVLLHGRGSDESSLADLALALPVGPHYVTLRGPLEADGGHTWFENRGLGRPVPQSLADTMAWFRAWLQDEAVPERPVVLIGYSAGAAFASGLALSDPGRWTGAAVLYGTVPWQAGVPTGPDRLAGLPVLVAMGEQDEVMPPDLMDRTWRYLTQDAGATVTTHRDPGGHQISPQTVQVLGSWLTQAALCGH